MPDTVTIPRRKLEFILDLLEKLDYEFEEDGKADFKAEYDCDWFFHIKYDLEKILEK